MTTQVVSGSRPFANVKSEVRQMVVFNPLEAADLSGQQLSMPDGSFRVEVFERIGNSPAGAVYRVRVWRVEGRDVDFTMPIAGYCAGELYQQTKRLVRGLVPEWAA